VDDKRKRELREAIQQDKTRGRGRYIDPELLREKRELIDDYLWILKNGTELQFRALLISAGWEADAPEFEEFVRIWRELRSV